MFANVKVNVRQPTMLTFGVSLDACVVAGSTFLFLSFPLFSPSPCPLFPRARRVYKQTRLLQQVFLMRFGLSSVCPRSFGSPFIGPHRPFFFPLFFHVFLPSCLFILILSFSCAHSRPDLSLYTYTHAYFTYSKVQVAQVRYNEVWLIGCPSSLGSFSSATSHLCLSCPFHFHLSLLRAHVPTSFPGRMEVTHASLRGGVCVCVIFGIIGILSDFSRGCKQPIQSCTNEDTGCVLVKSIRDAGLTYLRGEEPT